MGAFHLTWKNFSLDLAARPHLMGVVNVTPDSFSDGGDFFSIQAAVAQGLALALAGADILDVGGESTRPGSLPVDEKEESARVLPVIEALAARVRVPISVDTVKSAVARAALEAGASMVNDISAGRFDPEIIEVAAEAGVPLILMHMKGEPRTMQDNPEYEDLLGEVRDFLAEALERAVRAGVRQDLIVLDPGLGFGKTFDHNLVLINRLRELTVLGRPLLVGPSRKAFLGRLLGGAPPKERDTATAAVAALAAYNGADILRVHDVRSAGQALAVARAVMREHA
ncbi:MAG: dihydropteroate synthase [Thermodesulfobacteriota bacterium]